MQELRLLERLTPRCAQPGCGRAARVLGVLAILGSCGGEPSAPENTPPPPPQVPLSLEATIAQRYQEVGEFIERPALFIPTLAAGSTCDWHVTSTAWLPESDKQIKLLTLYTSGDGRIVRKFEVSRPLTPAGTYRVLVVIVHHPSTIDASGLTLWEAAQRSMNADLEAFAASRGYAGPLVTFENTNVLLDPEIFENPRLPSDVIERLAQNGYSADNYDVLVTVNIDPNRSEGGFAIPSQRFIYMGNFGFGTNRLSAAAYLSIARAVYGHEFAHLWGWPGTHDWAVCHSAGQNPYGFNFWVPPVLLGWEDVDGDRVPEILDLAPYGRPGL